MLKKNKVTPTKVHKLIKGVVIVMALAIVFTYSAFELHKLFTGPEVTITSPKQGESVDNELLKIKGQTHNISNIELNNRKIYIDKEGNFSEKLLAMPGYNIITVEAWDRFGRHVRKEMRIVYKK